MTMQVAAGPRLRWAAIFSWVLPVLAILMALAASHTRSRWLINRPYGADRLQDNLDGLGVAALPVAFCMAVCCLVLSPRRTGPRRHAVIGIVSCVIAALFHDGGPAPGYWWDHY